MFSIHFRFFPPFLARFFRFDVPEAVTAAAARSSSFSASDMAALYASSCAVCRTSDPSANTLSKELRAGNGPHQILYDTRTVRLLIRHPEHPSLSANREGLEQELVKLLVLAEQAHHRADEEVPAMGVRGLR